MNRTHGFYSDLLTEEEKTYYGQSSIDDALAMAYVQHKRAIQADRMDLADKALGRIAQLEKTRAELIEEDTGPELEDLVELPYED